jgi:transposase
VVVAAVPWARPGSRFTTAFEDTAAWLVCHATLSVVAVLLRVAWRSVADIVTRVVADRAAATDRLAGLRRIGIDEISYRKGQRYLLVVTDHDSGRLVWAGKGRNAATLNRFFDDLGAERAGLLTHVSADGARWIHDVVAARAPAAVLCLDAFHVVAWATEALDQVRRAMVIRLRAGGHHEEATALKHTRWALLKSPPNLTAASAPRSPGSPRPTAGSTGPTCSRSNSGRSSRPSSWRMPEHCWAAGSHGRNAAGSNRSSSSRKQSGNTMP